MLIITTYVVDDKLKTKPEATLSKHSEKFTKLENTINTYILSC